MVMANCKSPDGFSTGLQGEMGTGLRETQRERERWFTGRDKRD
jgi:hypothetical protein